MAESPGRTPVRYQEALAELSQRPRRWLVTGAAGFIGSNLVQNLLEAGQQVTGLDNYATGHRKNLEEVLSMVPESHARFTMIEGDIRDPDVCREATRDAEVVLHQAALGSVPRSMKDPLTTNAANVNGTLNMLIAARESGVSRFVYAASSSTYGDRNELPMVEERIGRPLSPYAVTKLVTELYASVVQRAYGLQTIGLRYFNVFGRRQDPNGAYAAVVPRWIGNLLAGQPCEIYGDGHTSRDFCYIDNVVQANILAAVVEGDSVTDQVYNVACGERTSLNHLFELIRGALRERDPGLDLPDVLHVDFRKGDIRHSQADIRKIVERLGYVPTHTVRAGLVETVTWYLSTQNLVSEAR